MLHLSNDILPWCADADRLCAPRALDGPPVCRIWSYECGGAFANVGNQPYTGYLNGWDAYLYVSCGGNTVLTGLGSYHGTHATHLGTCGQAELCVAE